MTHKAGYVIRDIADRLARVRYYPDKRQMLTIGEIHGRLEAYMGLGLECSDAEWDTISFALDEIDPDGVDNTSVTVCHKLSAAMLKFLKDPEFQPGPEHVREEVAPMGSSLTRDCEPS